jgi:putative endonuclease
LVKEEKCRLKKDRRREIGRVGEQLASDFLQKKGYHILSRNWSTRLGELDLVVEDGETLVFVEVRTTCSSRFGLGFQSVDWRKQQKVRRLALQYLQQNRLGQRPIRFDVISVLLDDTFSPVKIDYFPGAF